MTQLKNDKININCHSSLDGESHQIPACAGMTRKCESGRSMVEMLGVLAIIGVLSVAGIAGYSMAMRNYRANEIVNAASMFYVLAKAQNQGNGPSDNTDYETLGGTNPSGATLTYTNNAFTITFNDPDDCTMAANKLGNKATADCTNKKLTVNFGETVVAEDPTTIDNRPECLEKGYYALIDDADNHLGCYASESDAKVGCSASWSGCTSTRRCYCV